MRSCLSAAWQDSALLELCSTLNPRRLPREGKKERERRKTGFLPIACMHGWGVGGSNLGQAQVELSGLNRVFHELGPVRGVAEYIH